MKKHYISPQIETVEIQYAKMLCASLGINNSTTSTQFSSEMDYYDDYYDDEY